MTRLDQIGEDRLVARLTARLPRHPQLRVGPGDDCAVLGNAADRRWSLLKTDAVVEGVHFTKETDLRRVGWKALARAVSDIAAMGGIPEHALITVALPPSMAVAEVEALYAGLTRCAEAFGISIAGGETTRSPAQHGGPGPLFVSITLTGSVEASRCILRSGGRPGDLLLVTGTLGGSLAGKHLDFHPRLAEARWLTRHFRLRAMMDLSDGLASDLPRLAAASRCGYEITAPLPTLPGTSQEAAWQDGEDFELLFALAPGEARRLLKTWPFASLALTEIGRLTPPPSPTHGRDDRPLLHGFDPFSPP
ncbi:MAG TPA: thiamine-phosphate kinase [Chthoniobacteraceae bacterium]|nr:thiamine-phosphate kinase [Chthoniobacteraceae bacterium]